jgi:hypothetical protein
MRPKKQVSSAIRILREERDASARATHLKAAIRKFLITTNERKQMSTKTNFKRIALVAVAALGMGVLSSAPSQASIVEGSFSLTAAAGTATYGKSDSTTAATITLKFTSTAADTAVVSFIAQTKPADGTSPYIFVHGHTLGQATQETASATIAGAVDTSTSTGQAVPRVFNNKLNKAAWTAQTGSDTVTLTGVTNSVASATYKVSMDSTTGTRVAGTYTYTALAFFYSGSDAVKSASATVTFTVAALASNSTTASGSYSTAYLTAAGGGTSDEIVNALSTASTTPAAVLEVKLRNSSNVTSARESVTVTTTAGTVGQSGGAFGRSLVFAYNTTDSITVYVRPDGTAGTATITVSTPSVTFPTKQIIFYAAAPKTLVASAINTAPGSSATTAIAVVAKDANGNMWAGDLYTYSSATSVISNDGSASCSYVSANSRHECTVTGVAAGDATITVRDAATVATSTVSSNAVALTITQQPAASVKLSWDKATYAPGEKATLLVSVVDSAGKSVASGTYANLFATGGISLSTAGGNGSDTLTAVSITTVSLAALALGTLTTPVKAYTVYMPASGGTVTAKATGGTSLPPAGQVDVSASATVTDSAAAALAAVTALATTVASLRTLITTLTNLVLKIQKKVKA